MTIREGLLEDDINQLRDTDKQTLPEEEGSDNKKINSQEKFILAINLLNQLIKKEIGKTAKVLGLEEAEL